LKILKNKYIQNFISVKGDILTFKLIVSEPETRKSYQLELDPSKSTGLIGKKINDEFNGDLVGLEGYTLKITGGTDKDGFAMHPSIIGVVKKRILLAAPPGFHPKIKGQRKRKTVRGNTISEEMVQINTKVVKRGERPLEELIPAKPKEKKEEKKEEVKEEQPKKEAQEKKKAEEVKEEVKKAEKTEEKKGGEEGKKEG